MAKYKFPGSYSDEFYAPTLEQSKKPHVIVMEIKGKGIAVSQVFRTYMGAVRNKTAVVFDMERQYKTSVLRGDNASIIPLSELPLIFPSLKGMTEAQMVKALKGWAYDSDEIRERQEKRKKNKGKPAPFGL